MFCKKNCKIIIKNFIKKDGKRRNKNKLDSNSLPDYGVEEWRDGAGKYLFLISFV